MKGRLLREFTLIGLFGITLFLTFNKHSKSGYFNYHSEIWGDKAGYYVYLPAAFKYDFNSRNFPDSIQTKTGNGFILDQTNGKIITKYTCGVALMQAPFYGLADLFATPLGDEASGFSPIYHWSINVASVFYLVLGLLFLYKFLDVRFGKKTSLLTVAALFLATNLFYYSIDETGMSHSYSFSLFCIFLYFLQYTNYMVRTGYWKNLLFGLLIGLIVLIRPTNVLFLTTYFFLDLNEKDTVIARFQRLINFKVILPIGLGAFLIILPQLLYWHYVSGSFINYSYGNESFNFLNPKLINTWFAPDNGLFSYTPFYLLILVALFLMIQSKKTNGSYLLILFLAISYLFSSWWIPNFGCAFGARSYVEYLALFSLPVAFLFTEIRKLNSIKIIGFSIIVLLFIGLNLKMSYSFDGCFYGENTWDWNGYFEIVTSQTK